jgi:type IV pilus assembly protein PilB
VVSVSEVLIIRGLLPIETLDKLREEGDEVVVGDFVERGLVTPSQVASAKAEVAGLSFVELAEYPVDRTAVALVPAQLCRRHNILPIHATPTTITLAMVEPGDVLAMDDVRALTRMHVVAVVAERNDLTAAINRLHRADNELSDLSTAIQEESAPSQSDELALREADADDAPIVRFVNLIIGQAIQDLASDIHIEPGEFEMRVRYRIDGVSA